MKTNAKVYVMKRAGRVKLGHSRDPQRRAKQLGSDVALVHETDVLQEAERIERLAHRVLALHGKHLRGEWFEADLTDAISAIEIAIRQAEGQELSLGGALRMPRLAPADVKGIVLRLSTEGVAALDELRRRETDIPTRSEMARRCIEMVAVQRKVLKG